LPPAAEPAVAKKEGGGVKRPREEDRNDEDREDRDDSKVFKKKTQESCEKNRISYVSSPRKLSEKRKFTDKLERILEILVLLK